MSNREADTRQTDERADSLAVSLGPAALRRPAGAGPDAGEKRLAFALILVGAGIGAAFPWSVPFDAATGYPPAARAVLMLALGLAGLFFARRTGLQIGLAGLRHPVTASILIGAVVALYVAAIDGIVFRRALPPNYLAWITHEGLASRLVYYSMRAINEGVVYQLFVGSALVWLFGFGWRAADGRIPPGAYWLAMTAAHLLNIFLNVVLAGAALPTLPGAAYDFLRFVSPGVLWGYLYWRYGLLTPTLAHVATHAFLQPLLGFLLAGASPA